MLPCGDLARSRAEEGGQGFFQGLRWSFFTLLCSQIPAVLRPVSCACAACACYISFSTLMITRSTAALEGTGSFINHGPS